MHHGKRHAYTDWLPNCITCPDKDEHLLLSSIFVCKYEIVCLLQIKIVNIETSEFKNEGEFNKWDAKK